MTEPRTRLRVVRFTLCLVLALVLNAAPTAVRAQSNAATPEATINASLDAIATRARGLAARGKHKEAESLIRIVLNRKTAILAPSDPGMLEDFMFLAKLQQNRGNVADAIATVAQVARNADEATKAGRRQLATAHRDLGLLQARQGRSYSARLNLMKALAWFRQESGAKSLDVADTQFKIAKLETRALQLERARDRLRQARAVIDARGGKDRRRLARIEQALGEWHFRQARFTDSAEHYRRAASMRQALFGPKHLETAQSIVSLASSMKSMARLAAAEELYRGGLSVYEERLGTDHPYIATTLNNLGQLYYNQGRYDEAEEALDRAVEIISEAEGEDLINLAAPSNHLGYMY